MELTIKRILLLTFSLTIVVLLCFFAFLHNSKFYFFVNQSKLEKIANEIIQYQKIASLDLGHEDSYEANGSLVTFDSYRFLNGALVTHFGKTDRVTNPQQIKYALSEYLELQKISPEKYHRFREELISLKLKGFSYNQNESQINFHFKRSTNYGYFSSKDIVFTTRERPILFERGDVQEPMELSENWFLVEFQ